MKNHQPAFDNVSPSELTKSLLSRAARLADGGDCEEALRSLSKGNSSSPEILNARGVCLMRLGRADEAVRVFRSLVLPAGCPWMKPGLPVIYRTNFSTALLLAQNVEGVESTLAEIPEQDHPSVVRLRTALAQWVKRLTWWQRWSWKFGSTPKVPLSVDFPPGDFVDPATQAVAATSPVPPTPHPSAQQVA